MKRNIMYVAAFVAALTITSCANDEYTEVSYENEKQTAEADVMSGLDDVFFEVADSASYTPEEFAEHLYGNSNKVTRLTQEEQDVEQLKKEFLQKSAKLGEEIYSELDNANVKTTRGVTWRYETYTLYYNSVDANGNTIKLSSKIAYPKGVFYGYHDPDYICLDCHYTMCDNSECPSQKDPYSLGLCSGDALVVCPDYIGYGYTSNLTHPYLCEELTARNNVDCVKAALAFIKTKKMKMEKDYYTYTIGYSQGGAVALATQKYIENNCDYSTKQLLKLKKTYCGGGPYDPTATMDTYVQQDEIAYPCVLPLIVMGMKAGYPTLMKNVKVEDYFTSAFLNAGILQAVASKNYTVDELNEMIEKKVGSRRLSKIMSSKFFDHSSTEYKLISECLEKNNLTKGWSPTTVVKFYHSKGDDVVPYVNATNAYSRLKNSKVDGLTNALGSPKHTTTGTMYYLGILKGEVIFTLIN